MLGLAPHTASVIEAVSQLDCIRPYWLVGGTALSLQLQTRQSEDLDFQKWRTSTRHREVYSRMFTNIIHYITFQPLHHTPYTIHPTLYTIHHTLYI